MPSDTLLALDLASFTGWAEGRPGEMPRLGSLRLAPEGASMEEVHAALFKFLWERTAAFPPRWLVYEAPLIRQRNGANQAMLLIGLAITAGLVAQLRGIHDVRRTAVNTVRADFIGGHEFLYKGHTIRGGGNLDGERAKFCVSERCKRLGLQPKNYDESDAAALWFHRAAQLNPSVAVATTPLFAGRAA